MAFDWLPARPTMRPRARTFQGQASPVDSNPREARAPAKRAALAANHDGRSGSPARRQRGAGRSSRGTLSSPDAAGGRRPSAARASSASAAPAASLRRSSHCPRGKSAPRFVAKSTQQKLVRRARSSLLAPATTLQHPARERLQSSAARQPNGHEPCVRRECTSLRTRKEL